MKHEFCCVVRHKMEGSNFGHTAQNSSKIVPTNYGVNRCQFCKRIFEPRYRKVHDYGNVRGLANNGLSYVGALAQCWRPGNIYLGADCM
jgi:hypothetical protein